MIIKYADIFLHGLPGLSLLREVEFLFNILLGTSPI